MNFKKQNTNDGDVKMFYKGKEILRGYSMPTLNSSTPSTCEVGRYDIEVRFNDISSTDLPTFMKKLNSFIDNNKDILSEVEVN